MRLEKISRFVFLNCFHLNRDFERYYHILYHIRLEFRRITVCYVINNVKMLQFGNLLVYATWLPLSLCLRPI